MSRARRQPRRCACCAARPLARGLCARHYALAWQVRRARRSDLMRALVIHAGRPGVVVPAPAPATINALWTWDAAERGQS